MSLLVDTSVWSLAFRRDRPKPVAAVLVLQEAIEGADFLVSTGVVFQELLQGFSGPKARGAIVQRLEVMTFVSPDRHDHVAAAEIHDAFRRSGVQLGTIDALRIQLCIRHELSLLTTDKDFHHAARYVTFGLWRS